MHLEWAPNRVLAYPIQYLGSFSDIAVYREKVRASGYSTLILMAEFTSSKTELGCTFMTQGLNSMNAFLELASQRQERFTSDLQTAKHRRPATQGPGPLNPVTVAVFLG